MFKRLIRKIPEKYRILVFLVATSCVGVSLILVAVYNASSELEIIYQIDNMNRFARAQLSEGYSRTGNYNDLLALADPSYQVLVIRNDEILADSQGNTGSGWRFQSAELRESRVNEKGGYMASAERVLTWTLIPLGNNGEQLIMLHHFSPAGVAGVLPVYTKRLLVPAIFYLWLMVWMGYIVRFLTHKLSEQKKAMEHMALHDTLTGLPNRNILDDRLNKMLQVAKRDNSSFTIVMMDLDDFKTVNDTYGHAAGDALLMEVAARLKACLRPNDSVCRLGGDEFILLLDDMQNDASLDICKRVSTEISKPVTVRGTQIIIGSSMGVVKYSDHRDSPEDLIHKADQAMYVVKARGGGMHTYDQDSTDVNDGFMPAVGTA